MSDLILFLNRFPEEETIMELNQERIIGFVKYTQLYQKDCASVLPKTAKLIQRINNLGFITNDSQEGIYKKTINPKKKDGSIIKSSNGLGIKKIVESQRAYCDGFIRKELLPTLILELNKINKNLMLITYPHFGPEYPLTKFYFEYEDNDFEVESHTHVELSEMDDDSSDNITVYFDNGYYSGPEETHFYLNKACWVRICIVDMIYGHNAMKEDGLFKCIEKSLITILGNLA